MDESKREIDTRAQPDDSGPSPERQAELQAAYDANMAAGNAPYASVRIVTAGQLHWTLTERGWSGDSALPSGKHRANLTGIDTHAVNLSGIMLAEALLEKADLAGATLVGARLASASLVDAKLLGAGLSRAYRQLAVALRNQGMNEETDRFAYRAQLCQRRLLRLRRDYLRYLGSLFLGVIAGYGYRPLRTLFWYLAVIGAFAFAYFQATHGILTFGLPRSQVQPLPWYEALVLSVSSFHGPGFFQPVQSLGDPVAILAAIEAVFGLFIEVSFIATFTQRYFGK